MDSKKVKELDAKYMGVFKRYDVVFERGYGSTLVDKEGKKYIDFFAGISVNALGYNNTEVNIAAVKQIKKFMHLSNVFYCEEQVKLAKLICDSSFGKKVFFANTGAEANEAALKLAKKWGMVHKNGAHKIVTFTNSFHGRTIATLTATGQEKFHGILNKKYPGITYAKFNDINDVASKIDDETCAVLIEPIQAEGGVFTPENDFLKKLRQLCDKLGVLLIFDEVQTGMGRTGYMFAYEKYGVTPDAMTVAKAIGGGLPLSALVAGEKIMDVFEPGDHGTTMGGNPVACAAGNVVFSTVMKKPFLKAVREKGALIQKTMRAVKSSNIFEIRGAGLLQGVQLKSCGAEIVKKALSRGLIINCTGHEVIRLAPPLNITTAELKKGLEILGKILEEGC
jgi:predicted acetylornithine/succinylornithine family transaminase